MLLLVHKQAEFNWLYPISE